MTKAAKFRNIRDLGLQSWTAKFRIIRDLGLQSWTVKFRIIRDLGLQSWTAKFRIIRDLGLQSWTAKFRIIRDCYMTGENPVSWLAQFVFINLYVYLKTGLNWLKRWYRMKSSSN